MAADVVRVNYYRLTAHKSIGDLQLVSMCMELEWHVIAKHQTQCIECIDHEIYS